MKEKTKIKEKRIIKRSWLKISIILSFVIVFLIGLGVGLYFLFRNKVDYSDVATEMIFNASIEEVRDDIQDEQGEDIGVFFYTEDEAVANFLMLGTTDSKSENVGVGVLAEHVNTTTDIRKWYGIEIPEKNELLETLLTYSEDGEYKFYDQYESSANGTSETLYIALADGANGVPSETGEITENLTPQDAASKDFSIRVKNNSDIGKNEPNYKNERDVLLSTDPNDTTGGLPWVVKSGTTMFFDGSTGNLESVIDSWTTTEDENENYFNFYKKWLEILDSQ